MANIASQRKRNARTIRERTENRHFTGAVKTQFKHLEAAVAEGNSDTADSAHADLVSKIDKAVQKGAIHRNTGARKKARAARLRAGSAS